METKFDVVLLLVALKFSFSKFLSNGWAKTFPLTFNIFRQNLNFVCLDDFLFMRRHVDNTYIKTASSCLQASD